MTAILSINKNNARVSGKNRGPYNLLSRKKKKGNKDVLNKGDSGGEVDGDRSET